MMETILEDVLKLEDEKIFSDELELSETYTESNIFEESDDINRHQVSKLRHKLSNLIKLNKILRTFGNGYVNKEGILVDNELAITKFYHYLSPDEFEKAKGGICWDYAEYQYSVLSKSRYQTINFYIEFNDNRHSNHAFTIVKFGSFYIYMEAAIKDISGVYVSNHMQDIFAFVVGKVSQRYAIHSAQYMIYSYPGYDNYGCNAKTFMNYMASKGKLIAVGVVDKDDKINSNIKRFDESADFTESVEDELVLFEGKIEHTFLLKKVVEKKIFDVLVTSEGRRKYKRIQDEYINRNMEKLSTAGPMYLIVFGDNDHKAYFDLFGIQKEDIRAAMTEITKKTGSTSDFKFLRQNPILVVLYFCIRYFTLENDKQGVNATLAIFALGIYWSKFTKYFPKGVIGPVMEYTIDNMTEKFMIKKCGNIFNTLMTSINQSYSFHKQRFYQGGDDDVVAFMQRISNDQNSLLKKIANEYNKNYKEGKAVTTRNDDYDPDNPIVDDVQNASTIIQNQVSKVTLPIISNGVDLVLAEASARMAGISISDCREYLVKIMVQKNLPVLESLIESILFMFIFTYGRSVRDIKSQYFLAWARALFKKTNSNDKNLKNINAILEKWAEESGIYARYKREGSRINYKKGIFFYVILSIQKYS